MSRSFHAPAIRALAMLLVLFAVAIPANVRAQTDPLCFSQPGITNCISGRFLQFWQQNGGLPVFGYPITPQAPEQTPEGSFTVQYFERERFEAHPENAAPYDVQLGRLGDQLLLRQGTDWTTLPKADPASAHYFAETGHAVSFEPFYQYWAANGLQDPALNAYQRSLALFGLPLTELYTTTNSSGDTVLTQWFERARFEYHEDNPPEYQVLLGLLGTEWLSEPPAPPVQQQITITSPAPNATVSSPFTVSGQTALLPSSGTLAYTVFNAGNTAIGQGIIAVQSSGSGGTFSANISFTAPSAGSAIVLQLVQPGDAGQPPIAQSTLALVYQPAVQQGITIETPTVDEIVNSSPLSVRGTTTLYPNNGQLHFVVYRAGGSKVGEGDFGVQQSGDGGAFNADLPFTPPDDATALELELSERDASGNMITKSSVRIQFQPPAPAQQRITITTPAAGATVGRRFTSTGSTTQVPRGGELWFVVLDANNQLLGRGQIPFNLSGGGTTWDAVFTFAGGANGSPITLEVIEPGISGQPPVARSNVRLACCLVDGQ